MSTAQALQALTRAAGSETWSQKAVDAVTGWLARRTTRRGFLARTAVVGSALAVDGVGFVLKPQSAYASVCGPGASCSSGWTVFCATINKGVNTCPPGSIAAGWWKADGASLCGGKARYIVDCNATCSRCSSAGERPGICARGCWSCGCTCGPSGQCDQRRVCCNAFRYGQCNQQVRQVGGVVCRVVSCRPPWTFANCSTATSTDNRTRDHSSPALPSSWTPITSRYYQLGEQRHPLGATVYGEFLIGGGRAQRYQHGRMSWRSDLGAHFTWGPLSSRYAALGGETGALGFPLGDTFAIAAGKATRYQHGRISWHPSVGAFETLGPIAVRYASARGEAGTLGFPVAGPLAVKDGTGRASRFQHGRISWHPSTGAHLIGERIAARYADVGAEGGRLGYPVRDELAPATGVAAALFQHGRVVWSSSTGAIELYDVLADAYARSGAETGPLGLPIAYEEQVTGGRVSRCQTGRISAGDPGAFWTRGPITDRYVELGAEAGALGWPTTDEYRPTDTTRRNDFQHGSITYDETTGDVTVVTGP
ncbi:MAG: hypothetical protein WCD35_04660 [Mycobacteriales bacterium]